MIDIDWTKWMMKVNECSTYRDLNLLNENMFDASNEYLMMENNCTVCYMHIGLSEHN